MKHTTKIFGIVIALAGIGFYISNTSPQANLQARNKQEIIVVKPTAKTQEKISLPQEEKFEETSSLQNKTQIAQKETEKGKFHQSCNPHKDKINIENIVQKLTDKLEGHLEFPQNSHVTWWKTEYSNQGSIEAFWDGDFPPTYQIDAQLKGEKISQNKLSWLQAQTTILELQQKALSQNLQKENLSLFVTENFPGNENENPGPSAEFKNGKITSFSTSGLMCDQTENEDTYCQCQEIYH